MKNLNSNKETILCSLKDRPILLSSAQFYFIENYLRKQKRNSMILHTAKLSAGRLIITITRYESSQHIKSILDKMVAYLFAFQGMKMHKDSLGMMEIKSVKQSSDPIQLSKIHSIGRKH